jgi:hypothetical protein
MTKSRRIMVDSGALQRLDVGAISQPSCGDELERRTASCRAEGDDVEEAGRLGMPRTRDDV